jgi:hypothetical protein
LTRGVRDRRSAVDFERRLIGAQTATVAGGRCSSGAFGFSTDYQHG